MSRNLYYVDTETVGLLGPAVLIQYTAPGSKTVVLHHVWDHTPQETMSLIEQIMDVGYVGFNTTFDHYHLQKLYCMLWALGPYWKNRQMSQASPATFASVERRAVFGPCVKPRVVIDLFSHLKKGEFQKFMARESAWLFNVPELLAQDLVVELDDRLDALDPFYFGALSDEKTGWTIEDKKDGEKCEPGFKHLQLRFRAKLSLKAVHDKLFESDNPGLPLPMDIMPWDKQKKTGKNAKLSWTWMPYAEPANYDGTVRERMWPEVLTEHVKFWKETQTSYAEDDVSMLHDLDEHFGYPEPDDDSTLTAVVASVRFRGYPVDLPAIRADLATCETTARETEETLGCSLDQHARVKARLIEECGDDELMSSAVTGSDADVLTALQRLEEDDGSKHAVAILAECIEKGRTAKKKAVWLRKLLINGRFHPSYNVVGTNTDRMSGADSFNPQGIDKTPETRGMFTLQDTYMGIIAYLREYDLHYGRGASYAWFLEQLWEDYQRHGNFTLSGGDFDGFETALAVAVWNEEKLGELVLKGIKAYWVFGSYIYADILPGVARQRLTKALERRYRFKTPRDRRKLVAVCVMQYRPTPLSLIQKPAFKEYSNKAKNCWYALVYGAQERKIANTAGLTVEQVDGGIRRMSLELPDMATSRMAVFAALTVLVPREDRGFRFIEGQDLSNLQGYTRVFERERILVRMLYDFFTNVPRKWRDLKGTLLRNEKKGPQSLYGCIISAAIGGAMRVQARMQRQGTNFQMQSAGAMICKQCQVAAWDLQPVGCSPWLIIPMNVHDEIIAAIRNSLSVRAMVYAVVDLWRPRVPLIAIEWREEIASWADK